LTIAAQTADEPLPSGQPAPGEEEIVARIYDAVMERRLPPGAKLPEAALCAAFGVRRGRIRRSLLLLAARNIVELQANRGAFIAQPTADEARDVFEARRSVESVIARLAAERARPEDLAELAAHLEAEGLAQRGQDRRRLIRLSGEFHVLVARAAQNRVLHDVIKELVARTSLIIALYGAAADNCRTGEHQEIISALGAGDADAAARLMSGHLHRIESRLEIGGSSGDRIDLAEILSR
jgi:DNA-binding GntR family transcriptional regulator